MYTNIIRRDNPLAIVELTATGNIKGAAPIIEGRDVSYMMGGTATTTIPLAYLTTGDEQGNYSIELWFNPLTDAEVVLFNQANVQVSWNGTINFTAQVNGAAKTLSYRPEVRRVFYLVCNYTKHGMEMFVNAERVMYMDFDLDASTPWAAATSFSITGTGRAFYDGLAIYAKTLNQDIVNAHYDLGRSIPAITTNLSALNSVLYTFENQDRFLIKRELWEDWTPGVGVNVNVDRDGNLYSELGGKWTTFISIEDYRVIKRSKIRWQGTGVTVRTSIDGTNWNATTNNSYIPATTNTSPFNILIEVTFAVGAKLYSLMAELFDSLVFYAGVDDMNDTYTTGLLTVADQAYDQIEGRHDRGITLSGQSAYTINLSSTEEAITAVEVWAKYVIGAGTIFSLSTGQNVTTNSNTGGTLWVNGKSSAYTIESNEWVHLLYVLNTPSKPTSITVGTSLVGAIGNINLYRTAVTGQENRIYRAYFGGRTQEVVDNTPLTVVDGTVDMYQYDWTTA